MGHHVSAAPRDSSGYSVRHQDARAPDPDLADHRLHPGAARAGLQYTAGPLDREGRKKPGCERSLQHAAARSTRGSPDAGAHGLPSSLGGVDGARVKAVAEHAAHAFVSYTQADRAWAEWIAWQLEAAGHPTKLQAWDALPGMNFVQFMHEASERCEVTLAVLSPDYLRSTFTMKELYAAIAGGSLRIVRVREVPVTGILGAEIYTDLVGLDEAVARDRLLREFARAPTRIKPQIAPGFPGAAAPVFPGRGVRFGIPHQAALFSGRLAELSELERAFATDDDAIVTQTITGLGGLGKTQLAARYVHEHLGEYDVVAWIRADDGGVSDLARLAGELGVGADGLAPADAVERVLAWLRAAQEPWLVVYDDVASPEVLVGLLPTSGLGRVLVTSRHRGFEQFGRMLALDAFGDDTGAEVLVNRAGRPEDRAGARRLAHALGGLPLALAHAGAYCAEGASFDEYREMLDGLPARELFESSREVFYERTVASTWQASIAAAAGHATLAPRVLDFAAWLAPDLVPASLFAGLLADPRDVREGRVLREAIGTLHRFSLVDAEPTGVTVHLLLQKVVREDAIERRDHAAAAAALRALDATFPAESTVPSSWPVCEPLVAHVRAFARAAGDILPPIGPVALACRASEYLLHAGDHTRAIELAEIAESVAKRRLGPEDPATLGAVALRAAAYGSAGRTADAITLQETVLAGRERLLGTNDVDTLAARADLAYSYGSVGRIAEAIALQETVLSSFERVLGPEHPDTLRARVDLAGSYRSAGRIADAVALQEAVLGDLERVLGPDHPDTLRARAELAGTYRSAGRTADAIALQEALLAARHRLLGSEHPDTLRTRGNLANAYGSAGRTADAIPIQEAVLADLGRLLGSEHPDTLRARANLAASYWSAKRFADAVSLQETVVAEYERLLGSEHPDTLTARANLAGAASGDQPGRAV
ncbi:FxSxx-COOH system tetratricopeptide repeat protein [Solirubrobacter ginsenosidimutans]|uniref:FxSxx-COOH system tetratricopeptide repeat protein n=1 Tax=Solirubrobacter ginsenosidimutans TaxID=490573 RepID=A0A9X3MVR2_9ACTN|nr:FxSxx-COOH system tetratricopeptide repeat protein [Solirubrobacter ginsenosidimutans]MDA0160838.1 FxSxx-COOH system tetratricopeptide repeat protein [Solirubrobacter ginsenosidimutans]